MNILVVDDEQDVQALFEQRFRKDIRANALSLAFAHSGEEALYYLQQHGHEALLILSDINMPGMTGLELLQRIRERYTAPALPVLMISAYGDDDNRSLALSLGADDFLTKPLDFTQLRQKLQMRNSWQKSW